MANARSVKLSAVGRNPARTYSDSISTTEPIPVDQDPNPPSGPPPEPGPGPGPGPEPLPTPPPQPTPQPTPSPPPQPTGPQATGNHRADILGYLRSAFPGARPADLIAALPTIQQMYPGTTLVGDDKLNIPGVGVIDVGLSFGAGGGVGWDWQTGGGTQTSSPGFSTSPVSSMAGTLARQPSAGSNQIQSAYQQALLQWLNPTPPTAENLRNSPQFQGYQIGAQRAQEREYADAAERAAYEGYSDSGAAETERAGIRQRRGEGEAAFLGNLATTEIAAQRQQVQVALQIAAAQGDAEQTRELQRELADLDALLQRERLGYSYDALQVGANQAATNAALGIF